MTCNFEVEDSTSLRVKVCDEGLSKAILPLRDRWQEQQGKGQYDYEDEHSITMDTHQEQGIISRNWGSDGCCSTRKIQANCSGTLIKASAKSIWT